MGGRQWAGWGCRQNPRGPEAEGLWGQQCAIWGDGGGVVARDRRARDPCGMS